MRFFRLGVLVVCALSFGFAIDMVKDSEQFYVSSGLFADLAIEAQPCEQVDDNVNFACGVYSESAQQFQLDVDDHVANLLPGLSATGVWFNNNGTTLVKAFESNSGTYLFAYNAGGEVIIAFTPF